MKITVLTVIYAFIFALLSCVPSTARAEAVENPVVNVVEVKGLGRVEEGAVRNRISQRAGALLSPETVSEDIKAIYGMGYFDDVRAEVEPFEGGVKLIYIVREKPTIRRVEIYGNEEVGDEKLKEKLTVSPGSMAETVLIQNNADILRQTYEEEGYPLALVVPVISEASEGRAVITYYVEEGPRVKVKKIVIKGNREISTGDIRGAMKTKDRWYRFWGKRYKKAVLASDVERIKELYHNNGFVKAEVGEPELEFSEDRKKLKLVIEVTEGSRFRISGIGFSGNAVYTDEELGERIESSPGEVLRRKTLGEDVSTITEMYTEKGYALASAQPDIELDDEAREAHVVFRVYEDSPYRIGRIDISGNEKTRDKVIRREMRLDEGELFNSRLLSRSYERLTNLNFFEEIRFEPVPDVHDKTLDIDVSVKERSTGFLNVAGGYSSVDKFVAMLSVTQGNLGGRGQYLKLSSEFSSRSTLYEVSFREPWLFDRPVSFDTSVFRSERDYTKYDKRSTGFSLGLGRSFKEYWRVSTGYRFERVKVFNIAEDATSIIREQEGTSTTSSIYPSLSRDSRDNFLAPHRGSRNAVYLTYAGLGGDNRFVKARLDSSWYFPVTSNTTFSVKGRYGYATGVAGKELPLYERYRVGGSTTVRGLRDVGPKDDSGVYIGGEQMLVFNIDYTFPLVREARFYGGFFYDTGAAFDRVIGMKDSAGAGIVWLSPIGPFSLYWAAIINPEEHEPTYRWEFSIGTFF